MPDYLAPGVSVEETQSTNKPIEGVSTSTAGLVGVTERGPTDIPQLVTSYGEYQRLFGGWLPQDEFSDPTGRGHCYLPHAVEGFFLNGGKRTYVTRVLPDEAERAARTMFYQDLANVPAGDTVLLRSAQQNTGTGINLPLLYVLNPANFLAGDWVRIGDGSRSDYRKVQTIGAAATHSSLVGALRHGHPAGTAIQEFDGTDLPGAVKLSIVTGIAAGAAQVVIGGPDVAKLLALFAGPPPHDPPLLAIGEAFDREYLFAMDAVASGTNAGVTLSEGVANARAAGTPVRVLKGTKGAPFKSGTGVLAANAGDVLLFPSIPGTANNVLEISAGGADPERRKVGVLARLPFDVLAYARYPAGTTGQHVTLSDDQRSIVALPTNLVIPLDTVAGMVAGMTFTHGTDKVPVAAVDPALSLVRLATPLPGAVLAAGTLIDVDSIPAKVVAYPSLRILPLDDAKGLAAGMSVTVDAVTRIISAVDTGLGIITLQTALLTAPAAGAAVSFEVRHTTQAAGPGTTTIALGNRLGLEDGDVLRIGTAPDEEYVTIARVLGERGVSPDAGVVQLAHALRGTHASGVNVVRQEVAPDTARQAAILALAADAGSEEVLVSDGTGYALNDVVRFNTPDGMAYYHRLDGASIAANPRELEVDSRLDFSHAAGASVVERNRLFDVQALDAGSWGNRLLIAASDDSSGLASNADVLAANPPPGPGMFSALQLGTLTGIEPGSILELLDPDGNPVAAAPLLKARMLDRTNRLVLLDPPGLQAVHMNAVAAALLAGLHARVRSREFNLNVFLLQRPDPAVPSRSDNLLDQESFRQLSMDPRHSRYVERVIGVTFVPGSATDDAGNPLRRWDRRSEGSSNYIRVRDLEPVIANRQAIRLGPEPLADLLPSGLTRAARMRLSGGDDAVTLMGDAMYNGVDNNEPDLRTGLYALKNPQNISLIAIPGQTTAGLQQALIDQCEALRYRFAVLDGPAPDNDTLADVQNLRSQYDSRYAAVYHPWLTIADPFPPSLTTRRQYPIPPSGHVLGVFARVDNDRGVHKAPANEVVRGITGLMRYFSTGEQEILNPYPTNINVVRDFRPNNRGIRIWGARCITSDNEFKYVNVRRLLIFLEDSLDRGLQWVVFEPNAEELWARVRRSATNFLTNVWRNGALEGTTPEQGFFVKCDHTTMTRDDRDNGRLICVIGVAPVKPAEFVIIRIGLWTADAE